MEIRQEYIIEGCDSRCLDEKDAAYVTHGSLSGESICHRKCGENACDCASDMGPHDGFSSLCEFVGVK
jgi:hypothetical protein